MDDDNSYYHEDNIISHDDEAAEDGVSYLASLAAMNPVVEARSLVATDATQHAVVTVEFWEGERVRTEEQCSN